MRSKFFLVIGFLIFFTLITLIMNWFTRHSDQHEPGNIRGAYYFANDKQKVIVLNDEVSIAESGGSATLHYVESCWLIQLDAVTGKELKRESDAYLDYIGVDAEKLWLVSSDTSVQFHTRDPFSLNVINDYKYFLSNAEAKNPVFKGKIASWKADEGSGNILITSYDNLKYYVNPLTFEAHDYTNEDMRNGKPKVLKYLGMMEQDKGYYMAYTDSTAYELQGDENMQLFHLDKYLLSSRDEPCAWVEPDRILKKHVICEPYFIDGAFVYDSYTQQPLHFEGDNGTFIYHLNRVGKGSREMLTHIDASGTLKTQYDITQKDSTNTLKNAFVADGRLYLVFSQSVQARDISGKLLWEFIEDTQTHD
jgi:hypothetical protein